MRYFILRTLRIRCVPDRSPQHQASQYTMAETCARVKSVWKCMTSRCDVNCYVLSLTSIIIFYTPFLCSEHVADVRPYGFGNEGTWRPLGVNSCVRFAQYPVGGHFQRHRYKHICTHKRTHTHTILYVTHAHTHAHTHARTSSYAPAGRELVVALCAVTVGGHFQRHRYIAHSFTHKHTYTHTNTHTHAYASTTNCTR